MRLYFDSAAVTADAGVIAKERWSEALGVEGLEGDGCPVGVLGCELDRNGEKRCFGVGGDGDSVGEERFREVEDEERELRFEVSSAPEEVMSCEDRGWTRPSHFDGGLLSKGRAGPVA